jgi:glutathione S-transferase
MSTVHQESQALTLISHVLCPYVQRAAIVLAEKNVPFTRRGIDLSNKPDWFLKISPLGKTPVLLVGDVAIFESAVICEYLDETAAPRLHPADALARAQHRGWMEFGSQCLNTIAGLYNAPDAAALQIKAQDLRGKFETLEAALHARPYFAGAQFSLVDAVFAPVFRYFDVLDTIEDFGVFERTPRMRAWRAALNARASVRSAVAADYPQRLRAFLLARGAELSRRIVALSA